MWPLCLLPSFMSMSRYITKKLSLARKHQLKPSDFAPNVDHAEEFRVQKNRNLWIEHRPTSLKAVIRVYKKEWLASFLIGSLQWALQLFGSFFFFQALSIILSDPSQAIWYGWVIVGCMFVTLALSNIFQSVLGSMNIAMGAQWKAGIMALTFRVSQTLKNQEEVGLVYTLISNDADRIFSAGQFVMWGLTSPLMVSFAKAGLNIFLYRFVVDSCVFGTHNCACWMGCCPRVCHFDWIDGNRPAFGGENG